MQHTLPNDILHIIFTFYDLFQRAEADIRYHEFKYNYSRQWSIIMSEIQGYTPRYTVTAKTYDDTRFTLSLFLPDCDLRGFSNVAQFNSWDYTYQRKVLLALPSVCYYVIVEQKDLQHRALYPADRAVVATRAVVAPSPNPALSALLANLAVNLI